jgi:hypothetical protein
MPELKTTTNSEIYFDSTSVAVVLAEGTGPQAGAGILGLSEGTFHVAESPETFLARLNNAKDFAVLTQPNNLPVWINYRSVTAVRDPVQDEYPLPTRTTVKTVIHLGSIRVAVREAPKLAVDALKKLGAKL